MEDTARVGRRPEKEKLLGKATEVAAAAATAAREAMAAGIGRKRRREKSKRIEGVSCEDKGFVGTRRERCRVFDTSLA